MTLWTGDMAAVAETCGEDLAQALCDALPGIDLYVPAKLTDNTPLQKLPRELAQRLIAGFAGDKIYIPSQRRTVEETFAAVEALIDQGLTTQAVALKLGITQAYVFQVRRRCGAPRIATKPDPRQLNLLE